MWTCSPGCATRRTRGRRRRTGRGRGAAARPLGCQVRKWVLTRLSKPPGLEVAHGDEEGVVGGEVPRVVCLDVVERQPVQVADRASRVAGVGMIAVDQVAEEQVGAEGRVVAVALQLGGDPAAGPGERLGREGGPADHVGQDLQGQRQVLGADPERGARSSRRRACRRRPRSPRPGPRPGGSGSLPRASGRSGSRGRASPRGAGRHRRTAPAPRCPCPCRRSETSRSPLARTSRRG